MCSACSHNFPTYIEISAKLFQGLSGKKKCRTNFPSGKILCTFFAIILASGLLASRADDLKLIVRQAAQLGGVLRPLSHPPTSSTIATALSLFADEKSANF